MSDEQSGALDAFDLTRTFVHLGRDSTATPLPDFEWSAEHVEAYRRRFASDGKERAAGLHHRPGRDMGRLGTPPGRGRGRRPALRSRRHRAGARRHRPRRRAATGRGHGQSCERVAHDPGPRARFGALHHARRRHGTSPARLSLNEQVPGRAGLGAGIPRRPVSPGPTGREGRAARRTSHRGHGR